MASASGKGMIGAGELAASSRVKKLKASTTQTARASEGYNPFASPTHQKDLKSDQPTSTSRTKSKNILANKEEDCNKQGMATLLQLLMRGRNLQCLPKGTAQEMTCKVEVEGVKIIRHHYCGECGTDKAVLEVADLQWCETCDELCSIPIPRPKLELEIKDASAKLVATVFADFLLDQSTLEAMTVFEDYEEEQVQNFIGDTQVLLIHPETYRDNDEYETFEVSKVLAVIKGELHKEEKKTETAAQENQDSGHS